MEIWGGENSRPGDSCSFKGLHRINALCLWLLFKAKTQLGQISFTCTSSVNNFEVFCFDYILEPSETWISDWLCPLLWLLPAFPSQPSVGLEDPYSTVLNQRHPEGTTSWHQLQWFQNWFFAPPWNKNSGFTAACIEVQFFKGLHPDHNFSFLTWF